MIAPLRSPCPSTQEHGGGGDDILQFFKTHQLQCNGTSQLRLYVLVDGEVNKQIQELKVSDLWSQNFYLQVYNWCHQLYELHLFHLKQQVHQQLQKLHC